VQCTPASINSSCQWGQHQHMELSWPWRCAKA